MAADASPSTPTPLSSLKSKSRTLILCFDGTANEYDTKNTNVIKLYSVLRKDMVEDQLCYYQAGIGTYFAPGIVSSLSRWAAGVSDKAIACYLYAHVMEGYKFLMQTYHAGDKVCLFGFSRGAYIARAIAGMLHKVGLLFENNEEQIPFAYKLYKSTRPKNEDLARGFKATFSRDVPIEFVGVWDTVASVGIIRGRTLPFVDVNENIRVFRHGLALDEHRAKFRPRLCFRPSPGTSPEKTRTDSKEVWFAGCHADIGGGNAPDTAEHALANISLRWMIEQIVGADCPILFDWDAFARWNVPTTIGHHQTLQSSSSKDALPLEGGLEGDVDRQDAWDAVQPITDELKKFPVWWILEAFPMGHTYQNAQRRETTTWRPQLGRGRLIPLPGPTFHASVKVRSDDPKLKYKPRARYVKGTERYVT